LACFSWMFRCKSCSSLSVIFVLQLSFGISSRRHFTATRSTVIRGCLRMHFQTSPKLPWATGYRDDSLLICSVRSSRSFLVFFLWS
jgi:hypothetical protein